MSKSPDTAASLLIYCHRSRLKSFPLLLCHLQEKKSPHFFSYIKAKGRLIFPLILVSRPFLLRYIPLPCAGFPSNIFLSHAPQPISSPVQGEVDDRVVGRGQPRRASAGITPIPPSPVQGEVDGSCGSFQQLT